VFSGVGKKAQNSQQDDVYWPIANNAFLAFHHWRSFPSLQVGKGYKLLKLTYILFLLLYKSSS